MCTALSFLAGYHYFGRNLDLEVSYGEAITVTPRKMPLPYRMENTYNYHLALIGMAIVEEGYPLYFDATNEYGLSMAGLNFPGNAHYNKPDPGKYNITPFEFIPWILGSCTDIGQAKDLIKDTNLIDVPFNSRLPLSPLHWMISDENSSIVVEQTMDRLHVYDDPVGVLTNNPPFPYHMLNLAGYMGVRSDRPENRICPGIELDEYSRGMGGMGLPGDLSSTSRFVRAAFTKSNSTCGESEEGGMTQFFHILDSVQQVKGCCDLGDGKYEITVYSSCCNTDLGIYYCRTYGNSRIVGVDMHRMDLDAVGPYVFRLPVKQDVMMLTKPASDIPGHTS